MLENGKTDFAIFECAQKSEVILQSNKYGNYQLKWHHTSENFNCPTQQLFIPW
jgi:hypothetical protein